MGKGGGVLEGHGEAFSVDVAVAFDLHDAEEVLLEVGLGQAEEALVHEVLLQLQRHFDRVLGRHLPSTRATSVGDREQR